MLIFRSVLGRIRCIGDVGGTIYFSDYWSDLLVERLVGSGRTSDLFSTGFDVEYIPLLTVE